MKLKPMITMAITPLKMRGNNMMRPMTLLTSSKVWKTWPKRMEVIPRPSTRIANIDTTSPYTSKGEDWIASIPPGDKELPPTSFRDLLNAQHQASSNKQEFSAFAIT